MTPFADSPDNQRATVAAQTLVGQTTGGTGEFIFSVLPNTRSIIVLVNGTPSLSDLVIYGQQSGVAYTAIRSNVPGPNSYGASYVAGCNPQVDTTYKATWGATYNVPIYFIADQGIRIVNDSLLALVIGDTTGPVTDFAVSVGGAGPGGSRPFSMDVYGRQYTIPTIPSATAQDHPPIEVSVNCNYASALETIVAAASSGYRYRVLGLALSCAVSGVMPYIYDSSSGAALGILQAPGSIVCPMPPQGIPLGNGASIELGFGPGGAGQVAWNLYYMTEEI